MFKVALCCIMLCCFSWGASANSVPRRQCRAGVCDDRPMCPQSPCRCIYASKMDCSLYYQCVQGKPYQHRCSSGLLFNEETLTCDYDFNVNCSIGKTTSSAESTTGGITTSTVISIFTKTPTTIGNNTISDHSINSTVQTTEASSNNVSEKYSTKIYQTTPTGKVHPTEATETEYSDLTEETDNFISRSTQNERYSKSTGTDDETTDSYEKTIKTSDFPTNSSSDISENTTYSKSSDFLTETINHSSTSIESKESEVTISSSSTYREKNATISEFTAKDSDEPQITNLSSTIIENKGSITTISISSTTNSTETETIEISMTTKQGEKQEITTSSITTKVNGEPEITTLLSTTKDSEESGTTNSAFIDKKSEKPEITTPPSTTKHGETQKTTISPSISTKRKEKETTIDKSTTTERKEPETTIATSTITERKEQETTITTSTATEKETTSPPSISTDEKEPESTIATSTTTKSKDQETTIATSTATENETTSPPSTSTERKEPESTIATSTTTERKEPETTIATSTTTERKKPKTTIATSTVTENKESETTSPPSLSTERKELETTISTYATKEINESETTDFRYTSKTTSKPISTNDSTGVTVQPMSTEEILPEVTTDFQNRNWTCPSRFGLFPDESNCNKFYHCSQWTPYLQRCPSNLHFNPALTVCDFPEKAGCEEQMTTSGTIETSGTTDPETYSNHSCDCHFCELPIPGDCTSYITCTNNSAKVRTCGRGLYYNAMTETCDLEDNVPCENNVHCPEDSGRFPYPNSCVHYMECKNFKLTVKMCPKGTNFDKDERNCTSDGSCEDIYTSTEKTNPSTYNGTTLLETSPTVGESTETLKEISMMDTNSTSREDSSSNLESFPTNGIMSTTILVSETSTKNADNHSNPLSSFHPIITSTNRDITYGEITPSKDLSTTLSSLPDSTTISKLNETTIEKDSFTEKFTFNPNTTISLPLESLSASTNYNILSTNSSTLESFSTRSNFSDFSLKTSTTMRTETEFNVSTKSNTNPGPFLSTVSNSFETSSLIADDPENSTDASTSHSVVSITENNNDGIDASTMKLADSTTEDFTDTSTMTSVNMNSESSTMKLADSTIEDFTDASTMTSVNMNSESSTMKLADSTIEDFTDISTKTLMTTVGVSTETPSTAVPSLFSELTASTVNTTSDITEDTNTSSYVSTVETSTNSSFICPSRFGLFPDSESCFRFYHCSHWVEHHKWCPSGLHFNPSLQVCDWPYRAGCGGSPVIPTSKTIQPKEDDIIYNETCNCECCFYPHKTDCSKYVLCLNGVVHRGQCAEGLLFNPLDNNCDIREKVTCPQTSSACQTENGVFPHPTACTAFYRCSNKSLVLEHCPKDKHFKTVEGKCVNPCDANCDKTLSCSTPRPTSDSQICLEDDGLYPSKNDCTSYYHCAEGHAYFVKCPDGLHFNFLYGVCEPPCDARCDLTIDCPSLIQLANSKMIQILSPSCPQSNGLFPAAEDCSAYYMCSKGKAHLLHCPPGLHFSIKDETCTTPCDAKCDKKIDCTRLKSEKPKEKLLISSSHLPASLLCKAIQNGTLPHPKQCTSFYKCSDGKPFLLPCPPGLHYDPEGKECKRPCLAGCDLRINCPSEIPYSRGKCSCENCYMQDPTDCSAYLFCSQGVLTKGYCPHETLFDRSLSECRNSSEVVCEAIADPAMCPEPSGAFPYPGNCHRFVHCEDSVAHVVDCEDGLEFDPEIQACSNPKGYCEQIIKDPLCEEDTGYFAHPNDSRLFYKCENGAKYLKSCSSPLVYNAAKQVCDWPHNAQDNSNNEKIKTKGLRNEMSQNVSFSSTEKLAGLRAKVCEMVPGVTCPCACRVTTYDDCDSFYHCRKDGMACRGRCPQGLFFNRQTMVCDLPQNVECREFFFATQRRLQSRNRTKASLHS